MKIEQKVWTREKGWSFQNGEEIHGAAELVFLFAATDIFKENTFWKEIKAMYPEAHFFGCSTSGEICGDSVFDNSLVSTAIRFEKTTIQGNCISLGNTAGTYDAGKHLAQSIPREGLRHVFVLSDGIHVNGSELVRGLSESLPEGVTLTGGLAGDSDRFAETYTFWDGQRSRDTLAILGLYSKALKVGFGSMGGWDPFGPERIITRSQENILYELDDQNALDLYKKYLGEHANSLPAAGLLFPLSIRSKSGETGIVRTILGINEKEKSMTFAGDMPEGAFARFMKANFERLIDGANGAAFRSQEGLGTSSPELALLISCVGRKLVLKQRVEEEVEAARDALPGNPVLAGFYSYGEISPFASGGPCTLHNQTMTITTLTEE